MWAWLHAKTIEISVFKYVSLVRSVHIRAPCVIFFSLPLIDALTLRSASMSCCSQYSIHSTPNLNNERYGKYSVQTQPSHDVAHIIPISPDVNIKQNDKTSRKTQQPRGIVLKRNVDRKCERVSVCMFGKKTSKIRQIEKMKPSFFFCSIRFNRHAMQFEDIFKNAVLTNVHIQRANIPDNKFMRGHRWICLEIHLSAAWESLTLECSCCFSVDLNKTREPISLVSWWCFVAISSVSAIPILWHTKMVGNASTVIIVSNWRFKINFEERSKIQCQ